MKKQMVLMLSTVGLFLGCLFGFQAYKFHAIQNVMRAMGSPPITVSTTTAHFRDWKTTLKVVGSLRAVQGVEVTTETPGLIQGIYFKAGDEVEKGINLVRLNADPELASLAALEAAAELANITYLRDKEQLKAKTISQSTVDTASANLKSAKAQVEAQVATIAKKNITAPFSGRLGVSHVNVGQYLHPGDTIVTLQTLDPIYVDFYVPQKKVSELAVGQPIVLHVDGYPGTQFSGTLSVIDPKVDPDTRNIHVQATIANPDRKLLPGMFVSVEVNLKQQKRYLTIPQSAVSYNSYGEIIYIVEKDANNQMKVKQSFVKTGETEGDEVAIIEGLEEGQTIVTSGQLKLKNGSTILVDNTVTPTSSFTPQTIDE